MTIEERPTPACGQVLVCDASSLRLEKTGFPVCNSSSEDVRQTAIELFGTAHGLGAPTANADIYLDVAGSEGLLELFQNIGKTGSRMAAAVLAGKRPVDILHMTCAQKPFIGSGGYFPEDVAGVLGIMPGGAYDIASIITREFPQEELAQALNIVICF